MIAGYCNIIIVSIGNFLPLLLNMCCLYIHIFASHQEGFQFQMLDIRLDTYIIIYQ